MKLLIPGDPKKSARLWRQIEAQEEKMVRTAQELADQMKEAIEQEERRTLSERDHKERQLRNIQGVAEQSTSWAEVELFIRYQAARREIPKAWMERAVETLGDLRAMARDIAPNEPEEVIQRIHLELIRRVLGYTVRWHVWHAKGEPQLRGGR